LEVEYNLGTRPGPSELFSIKWENVDFDRGVIWAYASKTKDWRGIPISQEFRARLLAKREEAKTDYLIEYEGRPLRKPR
jgi:integrase